MRARYLGFVLLVWFPGFLHAQSAAQPCRAPRLNGGYLVPEQEHYFHGSTLTYGCDDGLKPAVEGWWVRSSCQNGSWSHVPECIDEKACLLPDIPHAKYTKNRGWYKDGHKFRITCDEGYEPKDRQITATCTNGTWSSLPVCEKSISSCGEPPKVPHAVIINGRYQEVYAGDAEMEYACQDRYTFKGADTKKSIICIAGNWTEGPTCIEETRPVAGQGGSAEVGTAGGHSTSTGSGTQPEGGDSRPGADHGGSTVGGAGGGHTTSTSTGTQPAGGGRETRPTSGQGGGSYGSGTQPAGGDSRPGADHGGSTVGGAGGGHTTSTSTGTQPVGGGRETRPTTGQGGGSYGSGTQPAGGGSSTTSGSNDRQSGPPFRPVADCGAQPDVLNGDVIQREQMFLKYKCNSFYTLVGSDTVACNSDRSWSPLPTCKDAYCTLDPAYYALFGIVVPGGTFLKEGEQKYIPCTPHDLSSRLHCSNGRITFTRCCSSHDHYWGHCR